MLVLGLILPGYALESENNSNDTTDFTLVKRSDGIALYERWYAIGANEEAREVKATFTIRTSPEAALALLKDGSKGQLWNKSTNAYRLLDVRKNTWISYIEYDLPWPVSNQDCVLQYRVNGGTDTVTVTFLNIEHPALPVRKRVKRIPDIKGKWIFIQTVDGVRVEYYITTKPSDTLPNWLTDPIIRNNLIETLSGFRSILESGGYQEFAEEDRRP